MIELRIRHLVAIAVGVGLVAIFIPTAYAVVQGGRRTPSATYFDGTSAYVAGSSFSPGSGHCIVYAVLVYDETDPRQLETGLTRCSGAAGDGTCDDVKFVETFDGSMYTCYPHGSFSNDFHYYFDVKRAGNADGRFYAHIGSSQSQ